MSGLDPLVADLRAALDARDLLLAERSGRRGAPATAEDADHAPA
ncbi:hypothetical protein PDG61_00285 [Mycolicibacterium sp. BiH015]|nr:hypothetical protein [Mycolicibacterium sp. BiH015]MDA2889340.1 hypothetical protein [Mycolicibacterium sp. BiH015]